MKKKDNDLEIQQKCWNKYKEIHEDKIIYLDIIYQYLKDLSLILNEFEAKYKALQIENVINKIENNNINETIKLIHKYFISFASTNDRMLINIRNSFKGMSDLVKDEKNYFDLVINSHMKYNEEKIKMLKKQKAFDEKMYALENIVKSEIIKNMNKNKSNDIKLDKKDLGEAVKIFFNYKISVEEANKKRNEFNLNQANLLAFYQKKFFEKEAALYEKINSNFCYCQKLELDLVSTNNNKIKEKKKINMKEYNNEIYKKYMSDSHPDEIIEVSPYNLKQTPYPKSKDCSQADIEQASFLSEEIIKTMRKNIINNFKDSKIQIQEALVNLPDIFNEYFEAKVKLTDDNKNTIINLIRNDISVYPQVLIILGKLRSNSKIYNSKSHIEFLEYILKEILKIAEVKKDYNAAKNCILLSQTYFIRDEKTNEKIYFFNKIKNNKWINSADFWRIFISNQLIKEFKRYELQFPNLNLLNNNKNLDQIHKSKIKEIMFSCLVTHISNLVDMNLDKRIELKILDELFNKYQYLDDNSIQELCNIISTNKEEITKLRKEYQENPNLEKELYGKNENNIKK